MFDIKEALPIIPKANAGLEPELLSAADARDQLAAYSEARKLVDFGIAALARKVRDEAEIAKMTGTTIAKAKETVATGQVLASSNDLSLALQTGEISFEQAAEIAKAEGSAPGAAKELIENRKERIVPGSA